MSPRSVGVHWRTARMLGLGLLGMLSACDDSPAPSTPSPPPAEPPPAVVAPAEAHSRPSARPAPAARPVQPAARQEAPAAASLDLRLPAELVEQMGPGEPLELAAEPVLLPPLFAPSTPGPSAFQLNGRLILDSQSREESWKAVEGAELQLQFKH